MNRMSTKMNGCKYEKQNGITSEYLFEMKNHAKSEISERLALSEISEMLL